LANVKNETFISDNEFEIRKKDEIKVIADLNEVIIDVHEYDD
jgi:hypothetical protein